MRTKAGHDKPSADVKHFWAHLEAVRRILRKGGMAVLDMRASQAFHILAVGDSEVRLVRVCCGCGRLLSGGGSMQDFYNVEVPRGFPVYREVWTVKAQMGAGTNVIRSVRI